MRAQSFPSGISSQLLALLGGYGSMLLGGDQDKSKVLDASEEAMLGPEAEAEDKKNEEEEKEQAAQKKVILSKKPAGENGKAGEDYSEDW